MTVQTPFTIRLPKWYDLHAHFRQGEIMERLIADHLAMGCAGILAMPNTKPPVGKVFRDDDLEYWSIEEYTDMLLKAGGDAFDEIIVPLYITKDTTPEMIEKGAKAGVLKACKYYPPHGTTGAEFGHPFTEFVKNGVFESMQDNGVVLCVHGEAHDLSPEDYFARESNAEEVFYQEYMPRAVEAFPDLKIVGEHVTTKVAVDFISSAPDNIYATVTPQHLLYTVGHLLKGLNYNLYCLPLLKFEEDRAALRAAVTAEDNTKFFAGTDSAPHVEKVNMTACGCAAGCYTGAIAPQVYAQGFIQAGVDLSSSSRGRAEGASTHGIQKKSAAEPHTYGSPLSKPASQAAGMTGLNIFQRFLCDIGPGVYALKPPQDHFDVTVDPAAVFEFKL